MRDLISREAALDMRRRMVEYDESGCGITMAAVAVDDINALPIIDAEPVRHGRWIVEEVDAVETKFKCSECGRTKTIGNDYFGKPTKHASSIYPYCHCGAKMDK